MATKPILFNAEMVRAILGGRKSCTRRIIKQQPKGFFSAFEVSEEPLYIYDTDGNQEKTTPPYQPGDILYVRETFAWCPCWDCGMDTEQGACTDHIYHSEKKEHGCYMYRASYEDNEYPSADTWHPSIHMKKDIARIWLKVTDVRVERLQDITEEKACMEGTDPWDEVCYENNGWHPTFSDPDSGGDPNMVDGFHKLWNSTIKKSDLDRYGWNANPWVWVIEFELCEKPKGEN